MRIILKLKYSLPLLLITLLCILGVEAFYHVLSKRLIVERAAESKPLRKQPVVAVLTKDTRGKVDIPAIARRNLFASVKGIVKTGQDSDPLEGVKLSSLDVVLMGTITGSEELRRAIIYDKKERRQEMYQIGDFIYQAIIMKILHGKVIINFNGKDEMLDIMGARNVKVAQNSPVTSSKSVQIKRRLPTGISGTGPAAARPAAANPKQIRSFRGGTILKRRTTSTQKKQ